MTTASNVVSRPIAGSKVALISGANKGIGRATAEAFLEQGFTVYVGSRDARRGAATVAELSARGDARLLTLDVTSDRDVDLAVARVGADFGRLDVLVNNAGVNTSAHRPFDHLPTPTEENADDLRFVYETNVFAVVRVINAFLPLLLTADAGRIVNVTSKRGSIGEEGAWVGQPDMAYSSSKTALNALTVHYARELADTNIKVNGAAPGHVATDFNGFRGTRTPEEGAQVVLKLATLGATGPSGTVYEDENQLSW